jgi:hypothetical protein
MRPQLSPSHFGVANEIPRQFNDLAKLICPTSGFSEFLSSLGAKNISLYQNRKSVHVPRIPPRQEGRYASSRTRGGMRWTLMRQSDERRDGGRRSRVVLAPLGWCQVSRETREATVTNKVMDTGESTKQPLTPSRREGRMFRLNLW